MSCVIAQPAVGRGGYHCQLLSADRVVQCLAHHMVKAHCSVAPTARWTRCHLVARRCNVQAYEAIHDHQSGAAFEPLRGATTQCTLSTCHLSQPVIRATRSLHGERSAGTTGTDFRERALFLPGPFARPISSEPIQSRSGPDLGLSNLRPRLGTSRASHSRSS